MHGLSNSSRGEGVVTGPFEMTLTVAGLIVGAMIGLRIGGIGVSARGTAVGVPAWAMLGMLAVLLAVVGNRIGKELDRPRS